LPICATHAQTLGELIRDKVLGPGHNHDRPNYSACSPGRPASGRKSAASNPCLVAVAFSPEVPQGSRPNTPQNLTRLNQGRVAELRETFLCRRYEPRLSGRRSRPIRGEACNKNRPGSSDG